MTESLFHVDRYNLPDEFENLPGLIHHHGEELAKARLEYEECSATAKVFEAELYTRIKADPGRFGLLKPTEEAIKRAITTHKKIQANQKELRELKHELDVLTIFMEALKSKQRALEALVTLHGQQYFSIPHAKEPTTK